MCRFESLISFLSIAIVVVCENYAPPSHITPPQATLNGATSGLVVLSGRLSRPAAPLASPHPRPRAPFGGLHSLPFPVAKRVLPPTTGSHHHHYSRQHANLPHPVPATHPLKPSGSLPFASSQQRFKNPIQDKLHHAQQSLNDLFSDLLSKPLSNLASNLTFDILTDKVKFPRNPLNSLFSLSGNKDTKSPADSATDQFVSATSQSTHHESDGAFIIDDRLALDASNGKPHIKPPTKLQGLVGRCYEPYGCFRITDEFRTIYRPINLLPESPAAVKVSFDLRTRSNPSSPERIVYSEHSKTFKSKHFRFSRKVKFIIHGYLESGEEQWIAHMSAAWLTREDVNVISVNWSLGASPPYTQAVANTRLVGAVIAHLLRLIQEAAPSGYPLSWVHIIGHSLGAHIAGYTGEIFKGSIGRITGLDPAQPYFQYTDRLVRLDPLDAQFVDVVHTDVSSIMSGGFGMNQTCGHVDFYPNGGISQPGCKEAPIKNVWDSIIKDRTVFDGLRRFIGCNHLRSFLLFTEAINSECPFTAYPCRSYDEFTNGQCTERLMESNYMAQCSGQDEYGNDESAPSTPLCPIRLGPDAETDYRLHPSSGSSVYFLQTADRQSFCHYHYDVRILFRLSEPLVTSFALSDNATATTNSTENEHALNGRLFMTIVGSRSQAFGELAIKSSASSVFTKHDSAPQTQPGQSVHSESAAQKRQSPDFTADESVTPQQQQHFRQHHLMLSHPDLGNVYRIDLEWRPTPSSSGRGLVSFPLQQTTRTLKKWLAPTGNFLESAAGSIPGMLSELQRTLNATQLLNVANGLLSSSHTISGPSQTTSSAMPDFPGQVGETRRELEQESAPLPVTTTPTTPPTTLPPPVATPATDKSLPALEGLILTQMESGQQFVFCAQESPVRSLFQNNKGSRSVFLLKAFTQSLQDANAESPDQLVRRCSLHRL